MADNRYVPQNTEVSIVAEDLKLVVVAGQLLYYRPVPIFNNLRGPGEEALSHMLVLSIMEREGWLLPFYHQ